MLRSVDSVIVALGGTAKVAEALGLDAPVVSNWIKRGIPPKRWPAVERLAAELDVPGVTIDSLEGLHSDRAGARA